MAKWDHLVESQADIRLRSLRRRWAVSNDDKDYIDFLLAWADSNTSAKRYDLDVDSRYEEDFKKIVDYARVKLAGILLPLRGSGHRSLGTYYTRNVDFIAAKTGEAMPKLPLAANTPMQSLRIYYPTEKRLRELSELLFANSPPADRHHRIRESKGQVMLFSESQAKRQPEPFRSMRLTINQLAQDVFGAARVNNARH